MTTAISSTGKAAIYASSPDSTSSNSVHAAFRKSLGEISGQAVPARNAANPATGRQATAHMWSSTTSDYESKHTERPDNVPPITDAQSKAISTMMKEMSFNSFRDFFVKFRELHEDDE